MSPDFRAALGFAVGTRGCAGGGGGLLTRCARQCPPRCRACPAGAPASRVVRSVPVDALGQFLPRGGGRQSRPWAWRALPPALASAPFRGLRCPSAAAALVRSKCPRFVAWSTHVCHFFCFLRMVFWGLQECKFFMS